MPEFYVYAYIDPRNDTPFYIGKGKGRRAYSHLIPYKMKNGLKKGWIFYRKLKKLLDVGVTPEIRILLAGLTESQAFYWESFFIASLGRRDLRTGCLGNMTPGGEGATLFGRSPSAATRQKISEANKGRRLSETTRQKMSEARKGYQVSDTTRQRLSESRKGRKFGPLSAATRQRISEGNKGKLVSPSTCQKISEAKKGHPVSEITRWKMSCAMWRHHWLKSGGTTRLYDISEVQSWVQTV